MFWPTERAKPQAFGATTVMFDAFAKKENIVVRKFIVSQSAVSAYARMSKFLPSSFKKIS